jgi:predicted nuclease of predicted toxin-antitoxin system
MLTGYVDECVNHGITSGLRKKGMDLVTAQEHGQKSTDDEILLQTATSENRLLLTSDPDFLRIHNKWMAAGKSHAGIVFWPQVKPIGKVVRAVFDYASNTTADEATNTVKFV